MLCVYISRGKCKEKTKQACGLGAASCNAADRTGKPAGFQLSFPRAHCASAAVLLPVSLCHFTTDRQGILQRKQLQSKAWLACGHWACRQARHTPYSRRLPWLCWKVVKVWSLGATHTNGTGVEVVDSAEVMAEVLIERSVCGKGSTAGRAPEHGAAVRAASLLFLTLAPNGSETFWMCRTRVLGVRIASIVLRRKVLSSCSLSSCM